MRFFCPSCDRRFDQDLGICPFDGADLLPYEDEDALVGAVVDGRYEVRRRLGRGGMGSVYLASQRAIDRPVCLKLLHRDLMGDPTVVKRFLVEAKAASRLTNPHTITIHDFGRTAEGVPYIAMEYLEGRSLRAKLDEARALTWSEAGRILDQMAESLAEAHDAGIVHRDLKPDNVFLTRRPDQPEFVKVLDFGIAQAHALSGTRITRTGVIQGTPAYLAPEVILGNPADQRVDIYALGILFYEMLAGVVPYEAETPIKMLMRHVHDEPRSIVQVNPTVAVPRSIHTLVWRCLAKKPDLRPADARAFRARLAEGLAEADASGPEPAQPLTTTSEDFRVGPEALAELAGRAPQPLVLDGTPAGGGGATPGMTPAVVVDTRTSVLPWVLLALLSLIVLGGSLGYLLRGRELPAAAPVPAPVTDTPTPAPAPAVPSGAEGAPAPTPEAAPAPADVTITLVSEPAGATVTLAEREVGRTPWMGKVPRGDQPLDVRLTLSGHRDDVFPLVPDQDRLESRRLAALPRPAAKPAVKPGALEHATPAPKPAQPKPAQPKPGVTLPERTPPPADEGTKTLRYLP